MRKILIVSPYFPPINSPDHQRLRIAVPYLKDYGWAVHILAIEPNYVEGTIDPALEESLPEGLEVTRIKAFPAGWTKYVGLGNLALRAWVYLLLAGIRILSSEKYSLVYFSTTMFMVFPLGSIWKRKFGIPYIVDLQDRWLSNYYTGALSRKPPGGKYKYAFSKYLAQIFEPGVMRSVSHITAVSQGYVDELLGRYHWLRRDQFTVLGFGASKKDFEYLIKAQVKQQIFDPADGLRHWVYVGRGGEDMAFSLRAFFLALKRERQECPKNFKNLKIHFIGTSYAPQGRDRKTVEPVAQECGVEDLIDERTQRVPYFEGLKCLLDANALIVPGSDDSAYSASKIYPYVLARKPLLAVFHENSAVVEFLKIVNGGTIVTFKNQDQPSHISEQIRSKWFKDAYLTSPPFNMHAFSPFTDREMARRLCELFDGVINGIGGTSDGNWP